ncbi:MAG TPA: Calx-beta domain-containing protein [Leptospiraceae bacterium]|nr:Calx-beta domain-containing protein [Leptospiraceae bacterium]
MKLKKLIISFLNIRKVLILCIGVSFTFQCSSKSGFKLFGMIPLPFSPSRDLAKNYVFENANAVFTNEYGRQASFTLKLSKKPEADVVIGSITSSNPAEGILLTSSSITFTPDNFDQPQTITLQGVADGIADGNQQYRVRFNSVQTNDYSYSVLTIPDVLAINTDKETASIAASPLLGLSTNENGQTASIYVVLSTQPGADVVIPSFSSDTTSECAVSGSLTFTSKNWDTPQVVTVTGVDDYLLDGAKNCLISSSASTSNDQVYVNKTMPVVTVVNVDNDTAGFTYVPITSAITTEAGGQAQFSIVLNTIPSGNITVTGITTSDPSEGTISPSNLSFGPANWNIPQIMTLTGQDDFMNDGSINYTVVFPNAVAINPLDAAYDNLALSSAGSFTNQDDDTRGFNIVALAPTTSISPISVTEGGSSQTFQVSLTSSPCDTPSTPVSCNPASITINLTNNNTSEYTISPSSLTFTSLNWNVGQTVTVTAVDDFVENPNLNFTLVLDPIISTTDYSGLDPADIPIQVINNDISGFTINPVGGVTVNENDPGGVGLETTITVVLNSEPTGNVTLGPIISTDTLEIIIAPTLGGGNSAITNRTLVFTPTSGQAIVNSDSNIDGINDTSTGGWNVPQTIRVRAVVDGTSDGTQLRAVQFGARTTTDTKYASSVITPTPDVPATNVDSGVPNILLQSISAVSFNEDGTSTITAQVVLATLPTANVTISNIVSSDITEGIVIPNGGGGSITNRTLVFTPTTNAAVTGTNTTTGGWNMPQTVTIQSVADGFDDGNLTFKITFPGATGAAEYATKIPTSSNAAYNNLLGELTLTNIDNDTIGFTISAANPFPITEGAGAQTFNIRLNSDPCSTPAALVNCTSQAVSFTLTNNDPTQYTISPTSLTFNAGTWNTAQTITVTPIDDNYDENTMDFTLVLNPITSSSDYGGLDPSDVTVRVNDNDTKAINLTLTTGYSNVTSSAGGYTEYNMNLGSSPFPGNTVTVTVSVPTAAPQEGKILAADNVTQLDSRSFTFTSANFSTNQTFRVRGITGAGTGSANFILTASAAETGTIPPSGFTALTYNNYNGVTATRTITNYHIGAGKKIVLAGNTTTISEAGTTQALFWVLLKQAPTANVTVNFGIDSTYPCTLPVGSPTTQFTISPSSLTITSANWNQITTGNQITISKVDDLVDDGDVSCPLKITSTTSGDSYFNGLVPVTDFTQPSIIVTDNDTRGVLKQSQNPLVSGYLITTRSGASASLQYSLTSQPMSNVVLTFAATGGYASFSPTTLSFTPANYNIPQPLTVTGTAASPATDTNYTITATASSSETASGFANGGIYNSYVDNQNATNRELLYNLVPCTGNTVATCTAVNATGGTVAGTYTTTEAAGKRYFAINLRARPTTTVSIAVSSSNTAEGTVSPATLSFTNANWNTQQIVTITGVDDSIGICKTQCSRRYCYTEFYKCQLEYTADCYNYWS